MDLDILLSTVQEEMANISNKIDGLNEEFFRDIFAKVIDEKESKYKEYFDANFQNIADHIRNIKVLEEPP